MQKPLKHYSMRELENAFDDLGLSRFRVNQILSWVYSKGISDYHIMSNIPKSMRDQLDECFPIYKSTILFKQESIDGSRKYLIGFHDGLSVETVGIPSEDGRLTVCVSSQVGCAMKCSFCATGISGFKRNLFPGEIVDQVLCVQNDFKSRVSNVVVMGQGEPFLNYENVLSALRIINNAKLLNIGARHITISTCGILRGISDFSTEPEQFVLAVSLHSAIQKTRDELMPSMKNSSLYDLKHTLTEYINTAGRRVSFEYALIKGVNDTDDHLAALVSFCKGMKSHVNLISLNIVEGSMYEPSSAYILDYWNRNLERHGISSSIRYSKGADISAACGQLSNSIVQH